MTVADTTGVGTWSTRRAVTALAALSAVSLTAELLPDRIGFYLPLLLHLAVMVVFTAVAVGRALHTRQWTWWAIATFGIGISAAQVQWIRLGEVGGATSTSAAASACYLVGIAFGAAGIGSLVFGPIPRNRRWRSVSDGVVVATGTLLAAWTFVFQPQVLAMAPAERPDQYLRLGYVAIDLVIGSVLALAAFHQPRRTLLPWFSAAVLMGAVADGSIAWHAALGQFGANPVSIIAWTLAAGAFAAAALAPDGPASVAGPTAPRHQAVYAFTLLALVALGGQILINGELDRPTLLILFVTAAAVIANQLWVNAEIHQLTDDNERALQRVAANERRFRSVFEEAPVGMAIADADGRVITANAALGAMLGVEPDTLAGRTMRAFLPDEERTSTDELVAAVLRGETDSVTRRVRLPHADGSMLSVDIKVSSYNEPGRAPRIIGVVEDVTERLASRNRLEYLATHDTLTGLANRERFTDRLRLLLAAGDRPVAIAFIDLDRFKVINDSLGHEVGDELLLQLAARLEDGLGDDGLVARFGGDEFTLLLTPADIDDLHRTIDGLLAVVAQPMELHNGERFHPTVSIGVTTARDDSTAENLISEADAAMYRAKERGRNRAEYFVPSGRRQARTTLRLMDELHRALERDEFVVHYQPLVATVTGVTGGYEALVRWQHPERGLLSPDHFLDVAEESGLIVDIGDWVLRTACARAARWTAHGGHPAPGISVNVAARQLTQPGLVDIVEDALTSSGLPADRLWLEMTETAIMTDARLAGQTLRDLRNLGLHLALDDFGTGYSSLTYLKRFPFETIKIDRSFVSGLGTDPDDTAIVAAVAGLARSLGLASVAEGVETPLQLAALRDLGCDYVQGYLLGRPGPDTPSGDGDGALPRTEAEHR
jgi:diguanylate cyclase (GGDEF)-like protein/PAS domain S-box-containing protein